MARPKRFRGHEIKLGALLTALVVLLNACTASSTAVTEAARELAEPTVVTPESVIAEALADEPEAAETEAVLVASIEIPRGTSVREAITTPDLYLTTTQLPTKQVGDGAIASIAVLEDEFTNLVFARDVLPGEQLNAAALRDPTDFESADASEFQDEPAATGTTIVLPPGQAVHGNLRRGDRVAVLLTADDGSGARSTTLLAQRAEVLYIESLLPLDLSPEEFEELTESPDLQIVLELDEAATTALEARNPSSTLRVVFLPGNGYRFIVALAVRESNTEGVGQVERGEVVDVVDRVSQDVLASGATIVQVSARAEEMFSQDPSIDMEYFILIEMEFNELLAVVTQDDSTGVSLQLGSAG